MIKFFIHFPPLKFIYTYIYPYIGKHKHVCNFQNFAFTGLKKKLAMESKIARYRDIAPWIKSICNHLYWCVWSTDDGSEREAKWRSLYDHIRNTHDHCSHGSELTPKKWIKEGRIIYLHLNPIIFVSCDVTYMLNWCKKKCDNH